MAVIKGVLAMRSLLTIAILLIASSASAQNMWQMNAAIQNQYNQAYQSTWPAYGYAPAYRPYVAPRYVAPRYVAPISRYSDDFDYGISRWSAEQDQLREMRKMNRTLRTMEWDLQDIASGR